jgi:hypothetical protein
MNIFVLDRDPAVAARSLCDKHVSKMVLETAQIMSTVVRQRGVDDDALYRPTHQRHPCTVWAGETSDNFLWLALHGLAMSEEYTYRYGRRHKSQDVIERAATHIGVFPSMGQTPHPMAMPDSYKGPCPVQAYRDYYHGEKQYMASWKTRPAPQWWEVSNG